MPSAAELTEKYISMHPSIKDCLKQGIINYSKLSRKIAKELNIEKKTSIEAILIACRRRSLKLEKHKVLEEKIIRILKKSELEIKNKIVVVITDKRIHIESLIELEKEAMKNSDSLYILEGTGSFTILASEKYLEKLSRVLKHSIMKISRNLAMITIRSPKEVENTPGVVAYLYSLFGEHGVNILETMSCWKDTIFVVSDNDIPTVMNFLKC
jgi:hypothetical protein